LSLNGITSEAHVDMWTALTTGLVDQQISNDPGGDRWVRLLDDVVPMFLAYYQPKTGSPRSAAPSKRPRTPKRKASK
jgi:hypothetical protein